MNKDVLLYKGYYTRVQYDCESKVLYGVLEGINDLVTFEAKTPAQVEKQFHNAVDDYLTFCNEVGKAPERTYTGTFNVRIQPELHKRLSQRAFQDGDKLNHAVEKAIEFYLA